MRTYHYEKYKRKYLELKNIHYGGKSERKSPTQSATIHDVGTIMIGNDGNEWIIKENKSGIKQWRLHKKQQLPKEIETVEEFEKIASQYAKDNKDDPGYKWMHTDQLDDYNFDNYLDIKFEFDNNKTIITVTDKQIHPEYRLSHLLIFDDTMYKITPKKTYPYVLLINKNIRGHSLTLSAEVTSRDQNNGLLNIEIEKKIIA